MNVGVRYLVGFVSVCAAVTAVIAYGPRIGGPAPAAASAPVAVASAPAPAPPAPTPAPAAPAPAAVVTASPTPAPPKPAAHRAHATRRIAMGRAIPGTNGLRYFGGAIHGSLYGTLEAHLDREVADPLTSVVKRLLVWWIDPRRDLRAGDRIEVLYSLPDGEEPLVHALTFTSQKAGRTFHAYLWKAPGAKFAHYFDADGTEVAARLVHAPVAHYQQITALLNDGRHHHGVDFKTPVGTPVVSPFSGVVSRVDWRRRMNGNCVDVHFSDGRDALFLHLSRIAKGIRPGRRIKAGEVVAFSGDTGHSFAPHLHYQLMRGRHVLNPLRAQKTWRAEVPARSRHAFEAAKKDLERTLAIQRHIA